MRKLTFAVGAAILAAAFPIANAQEDLDYRLGGTAFHVESEQGLVAASERIARPRLPMAAPHEETVADRAWPYVPERVSMGDGVSAGATVPAGSPWDRDYGFIAPAQ
jgi:hypothetical protein